MPDSEWTNSTATLATILLAIAGWLVAHFHKIATDRRQARLDRINRQLRDFYGPLYAILQASDEAWSAFCQKYWPNHGLETYFPKEGTHLLKEEELKRWVIWMREVFHPLNERAERIILDNMDLYDGNNFPPPFRHALAHVSSYRAILAQWEEDDFTEYVSVNNWPYSELMKIVQPKYEQVREEQLKLLGKRVH
ncbi:MAG: hypothetical protein KDA65_16280 [Planctomycetaceae bacterium]|nr:hypothetical protein [Planctomycetaceae bacterium]